jgi:Rod binding domain-containing protein
MSWDFSSTRATVSPSLTMPAAPTGPGQKAAREFEAQLIGSLLESMEKTFAALPGDSGMTGADDYSYLGTQALAGAMAERGGFGIAAMINRYFAAHEGKG